MPIDERKGLDLLILRGYFLPYLALLFGQRSWPTGAELRSTLGLNEKSAMQRIWNRCFFSQRSKKQSVPMKPLWPNVLWRHPAPILGMHAPEAYQSVSKAFRLSVSILLASKGVLRRPAAPTWSLASSWTAVHTTYYTLWKLCVCVVGGEGGWWRSDSELERHREFIIWWKFGGILCIQRMIPTYTYTALSNDSRHNLLQGGTIQIILLHWYG